MAARKFMRRKNNQALACRLAMLFRSTVALLAVTTWSNWTHAATTTSAPTAKSPSKLPSFEPTKHPIVPPTDQPTKKQSTNEPTQPPSRSPSREPSKRPTPLPTDDPTKKPTPLPSRIPSQSPSKLPTFLPTDEPTKEPTQPPSRPPSREPSKRPTKQPTKTPTPLPTQLPLPEPSKRPSASPTEQPTKEPTQLPTRSPSDEPSKRPTSLPTKQPTTKKPTRSPSREPSVHPTSLPTNQPTKKPTQLPTKAPSFEPSKHPTSLPTEQPTTKRPTRHPTLPPSRNPSRGPTSLPTKQPTEKPSRRPTFLPTQQPTSRPTQFPTRLPSQAPSWHPTSLPSNGPTKIPNLPPTENPTPEPTHRPTRNPTPPPTRLPSKKPSAKPTRHPTDQPTFPPTSSPSQRPAKAPSHSLALSAKPSSSFEYCVRDQFGVEKIYASGKYTSNDWYAQWATDRSLNGSEDPSDIDAYDDRFSVTNNGLVHINNGTATLQRSPQINIYAAGAKGFGDVEMTGYAEYPSSNEIPRGKSGLIFGIKMLHPNESCSDEAPSYWAQISRTTGLPSFIKEYRPGYRSGKKMASTKIPSFGDELPTERWIGVKFVVRTLSSSSIMLELYVDLVGGGGDHDAMNVTEQNWTLVHSYIDLAGSWKSSDSLPQDVCTSTLADGAVFTGRRMYGLIQNFGRSDTRVSWRNISIRSISAGTKMESACLIVAPTMNTSAVTPYPSPNINPSFRPVASSAPSSVSITSTNSPHVSQHETETNLPPGNPTKLQVIVCGTLNFKLTMAQLMNVAQVATFETQAEDFLAKRLISRDGLGFTDYNVTVLSQAIIADRQEPLRRLLTTSKSLLVNTSVTASVNTTTELADDFPFQSVIHRIILNDSAAFLKTLFSSDAFASDSPEQTLRIVELGSQDGAEGSNKAVLGSSIGGLVIFLSLVLAFFVIRRRQVRQNDGGDPLPMVSIGEELEEDNGELSSLDGSLPIGKYPYNLPHLPGDGDQTATDNGIERNALEQQLDWSLDDTFPLKENNGKLNLNPLQMANGDGLPHPSGGPAQPATNCGAESNGSEQHLDWSPDDTFPLTRNDDQLNAGPPEMTNSDESSTSSSVKVNLKQDSFIPCERDGTDEVQPKHGEMTKVHPQEADEMSIDYGLKRLYDKAMVDEGTNTNTGEDLVDNITAEEEGNLPPEINRAKGLKLFSCFADNTLDEKLTTQKILGTNNYRSDTTPKTSNTNYFKDSGRKVYEVRAPPGPLGILIDSSIRGPIVHEVKGSSPLLHLVERGDIILSVDGVDCSNYDADELAKFISIKPIGDEQVLILTGKSKWDEEAVCNESDMSI